ncbi:MAG: PASTA domain-containing protein [Armatimonadetes bacterium]|nr:PASTA domain-containing protein [Armatimonadota bacterium]
MIGELLLQRYQIETFISEGPIFILYAGVDRLQNRPVTIRLIKEPFASEPDFVEAIAHAVAHQASLESPYLEKLEEVVHQKKSHFIIGAAVAGQQLPERLKKLISFSPQTSIGILISLLQGLSVLHQAGIVHGDVSEANVSVALDGTASLQLGGIWTAYSMSRTAGAVVLPSICPYLAPEISKGQMPSAQSDIYSAGVLLFQMISGRLPYLAETPLAMALMHATDPVPNLRSLNPSVPVVLSEIIRKAMAKEPGYRYANAAEMLSDLRRMQDAMRFGRQLTWPLKPWAEPPHDMGQVAPTMSATRIQEQKRRKREKADYQGDVPRWVLGVIAFLALVVFVGIPYWFLAGVSRPKTVVVPRLQNLSENEASNLLKSLKLRTRIVGRVPSETAPAGTVIDAYPPSGEKVREGGLISLKLSAGSKFVQVPDLKGQTLDGARSVLGALDLQLDNRTDDIRSPLTPGTIATQAPGKGEKLERGGKVRVGISNGQGSADDERPKAEEVIPKNRHTYKLSYDLSDLAEPMVVKITVTDDQGTRTVYSARQQPNDTIELDAVAYGAKATFKVYYGKEMVKTEERTPEDNN